MLKPSTSVLQGWAIAVSLALFFLSMYFRTDLLAYCYRFPNE